MSNPSASPFASFWMGGFEGADHVNGRGVPLDMSASNGHVERVEADLRSAAGQGIRTVRESIGWRLAEPSRGVFDFERVRRIASAAGRLDMQVLWTFMHYGVPADVSLTDDGLVDRFACFAEAVALALRPLSSAPIYNLVNEIGFLAWAVSETNLFHPHRGDPAEMERRTIASGYDIKRRLVRAVIEGMAAIRRVDPRARFLHVEPMVHVVAPADRPELQSLADRIAGYQWQVWDMIEGRADPELGGHPGALDLIGINHYHSGQWEVETGRRLEWHLRDVRRKPFADMLGAAFERYGRPLVVSETSHVGEGRAQWLDEVMREVQCALRRGIAVQGVCLYPLIDRPDWEDASHWHHSGLWDVDAASGDRVLCQDYARMLARWQSGIDQGSTSSEMEMLIGLLQLMPTSTHTPPL